MTRNILAVVAGTVAAFVVVSLFEVVGHLIYPPPAGLDF